MVGYLNVQLPYRKWLIYRPETEKNKILEIQLPVIKTSQNFARRSILASKRNSESFISISQRLTILQTSP